MFKQFNNPNRFFKMADKIEIWLKIFTILFLTIGLIWGLYFSPPDYQQGDMVRVMYVHVPLAWLALSLYVMLAFCALGLLVWRSQMLAIIAKAMAPVGTFACLLALVTGSLWGKPMWGAWWVWDARTITMLFQLFLYIGYISLYNAFEDYEKADKACAVLALIGVINVPIVKFSVNWWATLHQPASIIRSGGPSIDYKMFVPLIVCMIGFNLFVALVTIWNVKAEILSRRLLNRSLQTKLKN